MSPLLIPALPIDILTESFSKLAAAFAPWSMIEN
jgi:hypothetical protein